MKSQSRRTTETFSYWQQTAPCGTDGHPCPPFYFSGFSLSPASTAAWWSWSLQPVQLLEGALTTRWLTCLLRLKRSSRHGALSQSRGDAELLLLTSDARLRDAELSIVALLRINPQWGGRALGVWCQVESEAFQSILLTMSYVLWFIFARGFWCETCEVRQVGHAWFKSKVK